jgi:hypothetical protein
MTTNRPLGFLCVLRVGLTARCLTACTAGIDVGQAPGGAGAGASSTTGFSAVGLGSPRVALARQSGPTPATASFPDPCEIDLDFGDVPIEQMSSAEIEIDNIGRWTLDLQQSTPTVAPEFVLNYGTQSPIQPGSFGLFQLTFQPDNLRRVTSGFTIQTDGANYQCPPPWDAGSIVTVQLTGTGAAVDAGPG